MPHSYGGLKRLEIRRFDGGTHLDTPQKAKPQPPVRPLRCHWRFAGPTRMIRPEGPARRPSLTQMPDAWMPIFREPTLDRRFCKAGNKGIRDGPNGSETVSRCLAACVCVCVPAGVGCLSLLLFFLFFLSIVHHSLLSSLSPPESLTIEPASISSVLTQVERSLFLPSGRRCCPRNRRFFATTRDSKLLPSKSESETDQQPKKFNNCAYLAPPPQDNKSHSQRRA
ncbi:hypothetical protein V8C43DRAFT_84632 [Trichoderma afarasin]